MPPIDSNWMKSLNLSDENTVKHLLLYRADINLYYKPSMRFDPIQELNNDLIDTYIHIDYLLSKISLKDKEKVFLELIFKGNSISDIVENFGYAKKTSYRILNRIVSKIAKESGKYE